jgi:GPN-loop GTPase
LCALAVEHTQTDTKGKGKAEEGNGKGEELADSIGSLSIGPGRTNFKKKPVIIIVIGMAGASISFARCLITSSSMNLPTDLGLGANIFVLSPCSGTGKTTLMHRLVCDTQASNKRGYVVNLDPAVMTLPFGANIDIRDTVRYKDVMKEYSLGPNGGILTSLNLFATKFDEVDCYNFFITLLPIPAVLVAFHSTAGQLVFSSLYCQFLLF